LAQEAHTSPKSQAKHLTKDFTSPTKVAQIENHLLSHKVSPKRDKNTYTSDEQDL
jgi:hypothetical protein